MINSPRTFDTLRSTQFSHIFSGYRRQGSLIWGHLSQGPTIRMTRRTPTGYRLSKSCRVARRVAVSGKILQPIVQVQPAHVGFQHRFSGLLVIPQSLLRAGKHFVGIGQSLPADVLFGKVLGQPFPLLD